MLRQQPPGPGEAAGNGLVAPEHERHQMAPDLIVAQALARLRIAGAQQRAEEILGLFVDAAAAGDHPLHDLLERATCLLEAPVGGRRDVLRQDDRLRQQLVRVADRELDRVRHHERFLPPVGREHGPADIGQGEVRHLAGDVDRLSALGVIRPPLQQRVRLVGHQPVEALQQLGVEGRLRELPLRAPVVALDADEPVADDHPPLAPDERRARIVVGVILERVHREVRVREQVDREERPDAAELDDVAVLPVPRHQRAEDVVLEAERVAQHGMAARAGNLAGRRHVPAGVETGAAAAASARFGARPSLARGVMIIGMP